MEKDEKGFWDDSPRQRGIFGGNLRGNMPVKTSRLVGFGEKHNGFI